MNGGGAGDGGDCGGFGENSSSSEANNIEIRLSNEDIQYLNRLNNVKLMTILESRL